MLVVFVGGAILVGVSLGLLLIKLFPAAAMRGDFSCVDHSMDDDDKDLRHMVTSDPLYRVDGGFL